MGFPRERILECVYHFRPPGVYFLARFYFYLRALLASIKYPLKKKQQLQAQRYMKVFSEQRQGAHRRRRTKNSRPKLFSVALERITYNTGSAAGPAPGRQLVTGLGPR